MGEYPILDTIGHSDRNQELVRRWNQVEREILAFDDGIEGGVDKAIKFLVISLRALDFNTSYSCAGHETHPVNFHSGPCIIVEAGNDNRTIMMRARMDKLDKKCRELRDHYNSLSDNDPELSNAEKASTEAVMALLEIKMPYMEKVVKDLDRLVAYLDEFYQNRTVPFRSRIILSLQGEVGKLECQGTAFRATSADPARDLKLFQEEMKAFAQFLMNKFYSATP